MSFIKLFIITLFMSAAPNAVAASTGYVAEHLSQAQFTTRVNKRVPVNDIDDLSTEFKKVYFFTDIRDCNGCYVEHQWWHKGKKVSTVDGRPKYDRYRWWTSKSLSNDVLGDWTVKLAINGKVVYSKTFTYYKPTYKQRQQEPVQQRVQMQEAGECELQLRHFSSELKNSPDDPYIQFMLKKWGKRCSGE